MEPLDFLWIILILLALQPSVQRLLTVSRRRRALGRLAAKRGATVVTLIHRQETISLLGVPLMRHIDVDDAESVLQAIRETPSGRPIELILHTPGGLVVAASQIAQALTDHDGRVTVVVPHFAMSGGTLVALAADEIVLDAHAALGPIDPQLGAFPAASILAAVDRPGPHADEMLILADISRKSIHQVRALATRLLERHLPAERARDVAQILSDGRWTHDHPLLARELEPLGLPIRVGVPPEERELLRLYPQPRGRQSAVDYFPGRPAPPGMPPRRELPRPRRELPKRSSK
ncbi:MAG: ATP-dependent Clp protease proteolytic subunit [Gaiellaceae bacterium]